MRSFCYFYSSHSGKSMNKEKPMKRQTCGWIVILSWPLWISGLCIAGDAPNLDWGVQFGTTGTDFPNEVAADLDGNVYVVGQTNGGIDGANAGLNDGFLVKINASGNRVWARQFGTSSNDAVTGVTALSDKSVVIAGYTGGTLGAERIGDVDLFVSRYDALGNRIWIVQMGTSSADYSGRIDADAEGNCYVTGRTYGMMGGKYEGGSDVFVCKLDGQGNRKWTAQLGTKQNDECFDIAAAPGGEIFIAGVTTGGFNAASIGGEDAIVAKLDSNGGLSWVRQFGTSTQERARCVTVGDSGRVYVGGWTGGVMQDRQYGGGDAFITVFDQNGNRSWTRQFGTADWDGAHGLAPFQDKSGDILVGGCWKWPGCNGWMRRYSGRGDLIWEKLILKTAAKSTCGQTVFVDAPGHCYHIGGTDDALFGDSQGQQDVFLVKLSASTGVNHSGMNQSGPRSFQLFQNAPNPFNPSTEISYSLVRETHIRLLITDISGKEVFTLIDARQPAGPHSIRWHGNNGSGESVGSGIYVYRLVSESGVEMKKMALIR
jgi:hypothetical protein